MGPAESGAENGAENGTGQGVLELQRLFQKMPCRSVGYCLQNYAETCIERQPKTWTALTPSLNGDSLQG